MKRRVGLAVWVEHLRSIRHLKRYGMVHYVSEKLKYAVLYVDEHEVDQVIKAISSLHFVRRVERSHYHEIVDRLVKSKEGQLTDESFSVNM